MSQVKLRSVLKSLKTGLNPRKNFVLNTPDAANWYITVRELNGISVDFLPQTDRVNDEGLRLISNRSRLEIGDVLFSGTGSIGKTAIVSEEPRNWNIKEGVYALKPDTARIDPLYLLYTLQYYAKMDVFTKQAAGSTVFSIPMQVLGEFKVNIPSIPEQRSIAQAVSLIDKKIALNNRLNAKLEEAARLLYDYWFVQFDFPDANNRPYKTAGGAMVYSKELKREIPAGWNVKSLADITARSKNGDWGKEVQLQDHRRVFCVRGADIDTLNGKGTFKPPVRYIEYSHDDRILAPDDLIIEISGGSPSQSTGRISYVSRNTINRFSDPLVCSNFCKAVTLTKKEYTPIVKMYWDRLFEKGIFFNYEGKTSGIKNLLFDQAAKDAQLALPQDDSVLHKYYELFSCTDKNIQKNLDQNHYLTNIRDWLLPLLMNGQVEIN